MNQDRTTSKHRKSNSTNASMVSPHHSEDEPQSDANDHGGPAIVNEVAEIMIQLTKESPSRSESLPRTSKTVLDESCKTDSLSSSATGLSLTGVMVIFTVAVSLPPLPSLTV